MNPPVFGADVHLCGGIFLRLVHISKIIVFVIASSFVFELDAVKFSGIFFVVEAHVLAEQNQEPQALQIVRIFLINGFINFKSLLEIADTPLARSNHQSPLYFFWLDLTSPF